MECFPFEERKDKKVSVAPVTDGLVIEMLPAFPVVDERLPSVHRQSKTQWQIIPNTPERPFSQSWGNMQNCPKPVLTYEKAYVRGSSQYSNMYTQYFSKGMIIDIWI
jgi:hypothetical protein